jgi:hypothetical protein
MLNLVIHVNPVLIHVITHVIQISGLLMCHMKLFFYKLWWGWWVWPER